MPLFALGRLDPILPGLGGDQAAACPGGGGGGEDGKIGVWRAGETPAEVDAEGAGRRSNAGHRYLLLAVHMHGVQWREARVHPGHGGLHGDR